MQGDRSRVALRLLVASIDAGGPNIELSPSCKSIALAFAFTLTMTLNSVGSLVHAQTNAPPPVASRVPEASPSAARLDRYTLAAKELFDFDSSTLRERQPKLDEIAVALITRPQIGRVRITGYTDHLGSGSHNLQLSQRRADAVKAYLIRKGVKPNRLVAMGKGSSNPIVDCKRVPQADLIRCLEPNRRVEVEQVAIE